MLYIPLLFVDEVLPLHLLRALRQYLETQQADEESSITMMTEMGVVELFCVMYLDKCLCISPGRIVVLSTILPQPLTLDMPSLRWYDRLMVSSDWNCGGGRYRMALAYRLLGMDPGNLRQFACRGDDAADQVKLERELTRVYRKLMVLVHPDKTPSDRRVEADLASRLAGNCRAELMRWLTDK